MTKAKLTHPIMGGATYDAHAYRTATEEHVYLHIDGQYGSARFYLSRDDARAIAAALIHEADWLDQADKCVPLSASTEEEPT